MKLSEAMEYVATLKAKLESGETTPTHVAAAAGLLRADVSHRALALKVLQAAYKPPTKALIDSAEG
jgi:hypothetical protein